MKNPEQIPDILQSYRSSPLRIGFSGGADSTALLLLLLKWQWQPAQLEAVHFDHGLRGEASRLDALWCAEFCCRYQIKFTLVELNLPERFPNAASIEDLARRERLAWYRTHDNGSPVVLAHHAGDAVENLLLKLARGGNVSALSSLRGVRKLWNLTILRPLLEYPKSFLEDFLRANNIDSWRIDSSNLSNDYHRNYLRNKLLVQWGEYHAPVLNGLAQANRVLAMDADFIESVAAEKSAELGEVANKETLCSFWKSLHPALLSRVLRNYLTKITGEADVNLTQLQINRFRQAVQSAGHEPLNLQLSEKWNFVLQDDFCRWQENEPVKVLPDACLWNWRQVSAITFGPWQLDCELLDGAVAVGGSGVYCFDAQLIPEVLELDWRRGGESMMLWGSNQLRRVKHILGGCKDKSAMLTVKTPDAGIIALGDLRRGNAYPVSEQTVKTLKITIKRLQAV